MKTKQYLVLGLGRFGTSVAKNLCHQGQEVLAVDQNKARVDDIAPYVTNVVQMELTDEEALKSLDVPSFDAAIVSIGSDIRTSILICVLLKELGAPFLIAKANDDLHAKVLNKIGVDQVIFPERDMGARLARSLINPTVLELMNLSDDYQIMEIRLPKSWAGKCLKELDVRRKYEIHIIAVNRDDLFIISPDPEMALSKEDTLLVLGKRQDVEALRHL